MGAEKVVPKKKLGQSSCDIFNRTDQNQIFHKTKNTRAVSKVSSLFFSLHILWTGQCEIAGRCNFWASGNTVKIAQQSLYKNQQNAVLKVELPLHVVALCEMSAIICFLPPKTNHLLKFIRNRARAITVSSV